MARKLTFERVVEKLHNGHYLGKISSADYSNLGIRLFDERRFAGNLGVTLEFLYKIELIILADNCGWKLPREPTANELLSKKDIIEQAKAVLEKENEQLRM